MIIRIMAKIIIMIISMIIISFINNNINFTIINQYNQNYLYSIH
jgi:hypothetical protein